MVFCEDHDDSEKKEDKEDQNGENIFMESVGLYQKTWRSTDTTYPVTSKRKTRPRDGISFSRSYSDRAEAESRVTYSFVTQYYFYHDNDDDVNGKNELDRVGFQRQGL